MQQKAEAMLQANHYDMDMIRDCAEKVASHWQQLMLKMEDRLKLVNASVAFYKTSEQVGRGSLPWTLHWYFILSLISWDNSIIVNMSVIIEPISCKSSRERAFWS